MIGALFWSVLNKHRGSSSLCFDFRHTLYEKTVYCYPPFKEEKPKLGNSVVYPEGACGRVGSRFQITALAFILQVSGWLGSKRVCSTELTFLNRDWICWSVQPDVMMCRDTSFMSEILVVLLGTVWFRRQTSRQTFHFYRLLLTLLPLDNCLVTFV